MKQTIKDLVNTGVLEGNSHKQLVETARTACYPKCQELVKYLKRIITSDLYGVSTKLQALRLVRLCMDTNNPNLVAHASQKLLPTFKSIAICGEQNPGRLFEPQSLQDFCENKTFWEEVIASIEAWAKRFPEHPKYLQTYQELCDQEIHPLPSHFKENLNSYAELAKELADCIENQSVSPARVRKKAKRLSDCQDQLQKQLSQDLESKSLRVVLVHTAELVSMALEIFDKWKRKNPRSPPKLPEPIPKGVPEPSSNDSMLEVSFEDPCLSEPESVQSLSMCSEWKDEDYANLKNKIEENVDLVNSYREDLVALQRQYINLKEDKEETKITLQQVYSENRTLKEQKTGLQKQLEKAYVTNNHLHEEIKAYKDQSAILKNTICQLENSNRNLQEELNKTKCENMVLKRTNNTLNLSNEQLYKEINKHKSRNSALNDELSLLRKQVIVQSNKTFLNSLNNHIQTKQSPKRLKSLESLLAEEIQGDESLSEEGFEVDLEDSEELKLEPNASIIKASASYQEELFVFEESLFRKLNFEHCSTVNNSTRVEVHNLNHYLEFLKDTQGVVYQDETIEVGLKLKLNEETAVGVLYVGNKSPEVLSDTQLEVMFSSIPVFLTPTCTASILPMHQGSWLLLFKLRGLFFQSPVLQVSFLKNQALKTVCLLVPISPLQLVKPLEYFSEYQNLEVASLEHESSKVLNLTAGRVWSHTAEELLQGFTYNSHKVITQLSSKAAKVFSDSYEVSYGFLEILESIISFDK